LALIALSKSLAGLIRSGEGTYLTAVLGSGANVASRNSGT
jgi:hypothetical protein